MGKKKRQIVNLEYGESTNLIFPSFHSKKSSNVNSILFKSCSKVFLNNGPFFDLQSAIQEPEKLFDLYCKEFKCKTLLGYIFLLGSLLLQLAMPIFIGMYIRITSEYYYSKYKDKYDTDLGYLVKLTAIVGLISLISEWIQSDIFIINSKRLAKMMRYDIYCNYFKKVEQCIS